MPKWCENKIAVLFLTSNKLNIPGYQCRGQAYFNTVQDFCKTSFVLRLASRKKEGTRCIIAFQQMNRKNI
jgi:hypothetical protein